MPRHSGGITPAQYAAMLEGYRFTERERYRSTASAVAWSINFAFADAAQSKKMLEQLGVEVDQGPSKAEIEKRQQKSLKLLRKIETARIISSRTVEVKDIA